LIGASPALATHGAAGDDQLSGTGYFTQFHPVEFDVDVKSGPEGESPSGTASATIRPTAGSSPVPFSGPVTCLSIAGRKAEVRFTNTDPTTTFIKSVKLVFEDVQGGPDRGSLLTSYSDDTSPCSIGNASFALTSGNVTVVDRAAPTTCAMTAVRRGVAGGKDQADIAVTSPGGLAAINNAQISNGSLTVPTFTPGVKTPVVVTATKADEAGLTRFSFNALNLAGDTKFCA
jgi:hypothetical protein